MRRDEVCAAAGIAEMGRGADLGQDSTLASWEVASDVCQDEGRKDTMVLGTVMAAIRETGWGQEENRLSKQTLQKLKRPEVRSIHVLVGSLKELPVFSTCKAGRDREREQGRKVRLQAGTEGSANGNIPYAGLLLIVSLGSDGACVVLQAFRSSFWVGETAETVLVVSTSVQWLSTTKSRPLRP